MRPQVLSDTAVLCRRQPTPTEQILSEILRTQGAILDELKELRRALAGLPPAQAQGLYQLTQPVVVLPPISPDLINQILATMGRTGDTELWSYRLAFLMPAYDVRGWEFTVPDGWYSTETAPITFSSDYYDPNLVVYVYGDRGRDITPRGIRLYPFGEIPVNFGPYWLKQQSIRWDILNLTDRDAIVTVSFSIFLVKAELFRDWYEPIIRFTERRLSDASEAMGGKRL